jgi:hypothetical protein
MSLLEGIIDSPNNPLTVVEDIAADNNWSFERSGEDEVTIVSKGDWTDYQLSFTWMTEIEALHLACAFDMKIPNPRRAEVQRLIAGINEQLWVGHFDIWTHTGMIMSRLRALFSGVPVRGVGGQDGGGSHKCGDVRYRGRGVNVLRNEHA